jgi:hypothetical protein
MARLSSSEIYSTKTQTPKMQTKPSKMLTKTPKMQTKPVCGTYELRVNCLGELLAKLHAPLVERVDVPNPTLGEDFVLVQRKQVPTHIAQSRRCGATCISQ